MAMASERSIASLGGFYGAKMSFHPTKRSVNHKPDKNLQGSLLIDIIRLSLVHALMMSGK